MISRRHLVAAAAFGAIAMLDAHAQTAKTTRPPLVGILAIGPQSVFGELPTYARFYARMRELGWREGENIRYAGCGAAGERAKLDRCMQDFLSRGAALVVTVGGREALAAKRATSSLPVVMVHPGDPVALGVAASLSRPGGNMTGNLSIPLSLYEKQVQLIAELVPAAKRVLGAFDPPLPTGELMTAMAEAGKRSRVVFVPAELPADGNYDAWADKAKREGIDAAVIAHAATAFRLARRKALADALVRHRIPALCGAEDYVESGCLAAYSASNTAFFTSAAVYTDKILRGAKPGELPIQQPTVFELVINMKTAKALGIAVPQSLLLRADRVIE